LWEVTNFPCNIPLKRPCGTLQRAHQEHLNQRGDYSIVIGKKE
jgi:hypothetical protein